MALEDYKDKGHSVELIGKEDVEGTPAYKLNSHGNRRCAIHLSRCRTTIWSLK